MDRLDRFGKFDGLRQRNWQSGCATTVAPHGAYHHAGTNHANDPTHDGAGHCAGQLSAVTIANYASSSG